MMVIPTFLENDFQNLCPGLTQILTTINTYSTLPADMLCSPYTELLQLIFYQFVDAGHLSESTNRQQCMTMSFDANLLKSWLLYKSFSSNSHIFFMKFKID